MNIKLYRTQARTMRALADGADHPEVRAELLALAERFTQLAEHAEVFGAEYGPYLRPDHPYRLNREH